MDKDKISKWCYLKIIGPGLTFLGAGFALLALKWNTLENTPVIEGPSCHIAPRPPPTSHILAFPGFQDPDWWFHSPLGITILVTIGIAIVCGAVLLYRQIKRKKVLKTQYEKGIISEEEYQKLK